MRTIFGIHHITAIADDPQRNIDFYTSVLGLRLVKVTVNFDDPASYHLYYGDGHGRPGTILTFFAWPGARRGRPGNDQVTATSFSVPKNSFDFWTARLTVTGVASDRLLDRFGQPVLSFADPDGLPVELVEVSELDAAHMWEGSDVPAQFAIHGLHGATLSETGYERTSQLLTEVMGFRLLGREQNLFRYQPGHSHPNGAGRVLDVVCAPAGAGGRIAVGTVHHIAFRTPDDAQQREWLGELTQLGYNVSPVMDRVYFHSIYYREPGGILFEIATDSPGFAIDEPVEDLGETLQLPPWLEPLRGRIEIALPPLQRRATQRMMSR